MDKIKAALLATCLTVGVLAAPYFLGKLLAFVSPDFVGDAYWPSGLLALVVGVVVYVLWRTAYTAICDYLLDRRKQ